MNSKKLNPDLISLQDSAAPGAYRPIYLARNFDRESLQKATKRFKTDTNTWAEAKVLALDYFKRVAGADPSNENVEFYPAEKKPKIRKSEYKCDRWWKVTLSTEKERKKIQTAVKVREEMRLPEASEKAHATNEE